MAPDNFTRPYHAPMPFPLLDDLTLPGAAGVALHAVRGGDPAGPPVVLLHGFPEFWYGWRHQIGPLADAGLRVLAPDQRGYNTSDKPPRSATYNLDCWPTTSTALIDALGADACRRRRPRLGRDRRLVAGGDTAGAGSSRLADPERPAPGRHAAGAADRPAATAAELVRVVIQVPWLMEWAARRGNWAG